MKVAAEYDGRESRQAGVELAPEFDDALVRAELPTWSEGAAVRIWIVGCESAEGIRRFLSMAAGSPPSWNVKSRVFVTDASRSVLDAARRAPAMDSPAALTRGAGKRAGDKRAAAPKEGSSAGGSSVTSSSVNGGERFGVPQVERGRGEPLPPEVFQSLLFAEHDLLRTPPFARLDCIYCARRLGEFTADEAATIYELFHYALRGGGRLLVDPAETPPPARLFEPVAGCRGLYRRIARESAGSRPPPPPAGMIDGRKRRQAGPATPAGNDRATPDATDRGDRSEEAWRRLTAEYRRATAELENYQAEFQATYEELQARNEELQVAEQSLEVQNDELSRTNRRLQQSVVSLERARDDVTNLLGNSEQVMLVLDSERRVQYFNRAAAELFGLEADSVGRSVDEFAWRFDDDGFVGYCDEVVDRLDPRRRDATTSDGRFVQLKINPYRSRDRRVAGVVITGADLTEVRRAGLRQALLATVLLDSPLAVIVLDVAGTIITWNDGAERIYGFKADEMLGTTIERFLGSVQVGSAQGLLPSGANVVASNTTGLPAPGTAKWPGPNTGFTMPSTDLHAPPGLTVPPGFSVPPGLSASPGLSAATAIGAGAAAGTAANTAGADSDEADLVRQIRGRVVGYETAQRRIDGRRIVVSITASPVCNRTGEAAAHSVIVRDITAERALEQAALDAATAEQRRIGRELHDGIGQELTALGIQAGTLVEALKAVGHPETGLAATIYDSLRRALGEVRALSKGLIPIEFEEGDLGSALSALVERLPRPPDCEVRFRREGSTPVEHQAVAVQIYRIGQEALTNALKHSGARHIDVTLTTSRRRIVLRVVDDGIGIDERRGDEGVGIATMRYRASLIKATLTLSGNGRRGTIVTCTLDDKQVV